MTSRYALTTVLAVRRITRLGAAVLKPSAEYAVNAVGAAAADNLTMNDRDRYPRRRVQAVRTTDGVVLEVFKIYSGDEKRLLVTVILSHYQAQQLAIALAGLPSVAT